MGEEHRPECGLYRRRRPGLESGSKPSMILGYVGTDPWLGVFLSNWVRVWTGSQKNLCNRVGVGSLRWHLGCRGE